MFTAESLLRIELWQIMFIEIITFLYAVVVGLAIKPKYAFYSGLILIILLFVFEISGRTLQPADFSELKEFIFYTAAEAAVFISGLSAGATSVYFIRWRKNTEATKYTLTLIKICVISSVVTFLYFLLTLYRWGEYSNSDPRYNHPSFNSQNTGLTDSWE